MEDGKQRPSTVRYRVVSVTTLAAVLLYLDRFCIGFAGTYIREEFGLTNTQMGIILGSFFVTYALAQVPSGWLGDRFGSRRMLTVYILLWSLFTGLTGLAAGFVSLLILRLGFGFAQAGAYPTSANVLSKWVPLAARGTASSIVSAGGRLGGILAPGLTGLLILLLVPPDVPSQLSSEDLLSAPRFAWQLSRAEDRNGPWRKPSEAQEHVGSLIWPHLSDSIRGKIIALAKRYQEHAQPDAEMADQKEQAEPLDETSAALEPAYEQQWLDEVNEALLAENFYDAQALSGVKLETEVERLAERDWQALAPEEKTRLNRLILEAVYPQAIRKVYGAGWRPTLMIYGIAGLVVAAFYWIVVRNRPRQHPLVSDRELALIEYGRTKTPQADEPHVGGVPLLALIRSVSMWLNCLMQFTINIGWIFIPLWLPEYLAQAHQVPLRERLIMTQIPLLIGWFGMLGGGPLTDGMVKLVGLRWGRSLPMAVTKLFALAAYLGLYVSDLYGATTAWGAVILFSVIAFSTDLGVPAIWAYMQDVGGEHTGSILGWGNMWGNFGAAVAPMLVGWVVGDGQNWSTAFLLGAAAFLLSGLAALGIDVTVPILEEPEEAEVLEPEEDGESREHDPYRAPPEG